MTTDTGGEDVISKWTNVAIHVDRRCRAAYHMQSIKTPKIFTVIAIRERFVCLHANNLPECDRPNVYRTDRTFGAKQFANYSNVITISDRLRSECHFQS